MNHDRMTVLQAMMDQGMIPVFFHPDTEVCLKVIQACANGGAKCVEFTNRGDFAPQIFLDVARHFAKADPSLILGVGSIVDAPTAGIYIANGAKFLRALQAADESLDQGDVRFGGVGYDGKSRPDLSNT